ncbi:glycerophosphodiester phosphodiesterase, cytosolic (plasmid) [Legionella adelaidensis]|uniref:Glycerophosphodiester phosphodiesterase, cytosolic n=1 Tax=Legionella adelaidensis TaxID=45056 RepID=A0A0W0R548_9GAMM|nr:glycerophosphodiester phosphodiesterase [Legionella adelaidensis]KTC66146.1 glycerophosphodiester phosphodiesterase, cytosolic [Legionella adelaidensis]VEH85658.1 glycerophosphodiester phosphodiesterase, cytosolic [Legionella adelaidensis]
MELPRIIAHRGASAYAPENTIVAFEKAVEMGARCIEFDVMLSADGLPFIFHDEKLKRTTNGKGEVGLVTGEYLRNLDAGRWYSKRFTGTKIPDFVETLHWLVDKGVNANIEIKPYPGTTEQTTTTILSHLNRFWPAQKTFPLVSSFDLEALKLCRSISPEIPLGLLFDEWNENWLKLAKDLDCFSVHFNKNALNKKRVQAIKEQGYKLCAYTVNSRRQANKLFKWGVDAIFSDYPDLLS